VVVAPSANYNSLPLEGISNSRMSLHYNQLDELFSFQNRERALYPLPLLQKKNRRGLDEIWRRV
jgi:hypothetical protein